MHDFFCVLNLYTFQRPSQTLIPSEGKTFFQESNGDVSLFADFSLKLVGEIHSPSPHLGMEGQWLVSCTGFVFSKKFTRQKARLCFLYETILY